MKVEFQNSIKVFLCRITDIKIAWINPCSMNMAKPYVNQC